MFMMCGSGSGTLVTAWGGRGGVTVGNNGQGKGEGILK